MGQSVDDTSPVAGETQPKAKTNLLARSLAVTASSNPSGVLGLDVSGWQADPATYTQSQVNWTTQWNLGGRFVYAKATEGTSMVDGSRNSHLAGAKAVGMLTGAYHFALPSQSSALAQANFFVQNGGGWKANSSTLPPLLDIENNPYSSLGNSCYGMTPAAMVAWIKAFSSRIQALTGRLPAIYTNYYWWLNCTGNSTAFTNQPLHIAAYGTSSPWMPGGWTNYSFWQYSDNGPFAGDSNTWNGTLANLKTFAAQASATTPPVTPPVVTPPAQPSITSPADIVTADSEGNLWTYAANGRGGFGARTQIGVGWRALRSINVIDWDNNGTLDIVAQWNSGAVTLYKGRATGGFETPVSLAASGWSGYQLTIGYWLKNSNYPQILSRSDSGQLKLWKSAGGGIDAGTVIGAGWGSLNLTMVDFDGDGNPDILAQDSAGSVRLYRSNGTGGFVSEARKVIATGWNSYTSVSVYSGFTSSASVGLIRRTTAGALNYVAVPGNSTFGAQSTVGNGWSSFLIAGGENINAVTVAPLQKPSAPPAPTVTGGNASLTAKVTAASSGAAATSVKVTASPGGAGCAISAAAGSCVIGGLSNGTRYTVTAVASNAAGASPNSASSTAVTPVLPVVRLAGADRYEASAAISKASFPASVTTVYIASGITFPDALSGAAAAASKGSPVLLATTTGIPSATRSELSRLKPQKIILLGGTGTLNNDVQTELKKYAATVTRIGGLDRYEVSAAISKASFSSATSKVYIANGTVFPDAVSGAAAAGMNTSPVLLTTSDGIPGAVRTELTRLKPTQIILLGGTGSLSPTLAAALKPYAGSVSRYSGMDRYETSAAISKASFTGTGGTIFIANGTTFPDALSGAPAAAAAKAPVLLASATGLPPTIKAELVRLKPRQIVVLGGVGSISAALENELGQYAQ